MDSSPEAPKPTAKEIATNLRGQIADGTYGPNAQLPPARKLAKEFGVQLMTVQSAIRQLRDEGLVVTQQGRGTFVRDPAVPLGTEAGSSPAFTALASELSVIHETLRQLGDRMDRLEQLVGRETPPSQ
ncbi:GntR family transcriptional regulator [Streptomyces sp. Wb2n-11]|uniref:GntR family transcriptional regulator n=1 Tax=Streptomyces sp. Wb2n-11 TaxID=1030533 RepID=UPI000ACDE02A|nr:winged helix-turn-helix domain-containing protein [Streptomyces sp. Wb2n-11]